jgi:hypothetical protein
MFMSTSPVTNELVIIAKLLYEAGLTAELLLCPLRFYWERV